MKKTLHVGLAVISLLLSALVSGCSTCNGIPGGDPKSLPGSRAIRLAEITWVKTQSFDFEDPSTLSAFKQINGQWEIKGGKLWAVTGKTERVILLTQCSAGPIRIEFEATNYANDKGRIGDITVLINSSAETRDSPKWFNEANSRGYLLTTGSYGNNCSTFYKKARPFARTELSPIESGKSNRMALELNKGHIRYWMNDRIILEAWDDDPLELDPNLWIGFRTFATLMAIDNVTVYRKE